MPTYIYMHVLISVVLWSLLTENGETALTSTPVCQEDVAGTCLQEALASVQPSACNWYLLLPVLQQCISEAVSGCSTVSIDQWVAIVSQFNATLNAGVPNTPCSPSCPNPQASFNNMLQCFTASDPSTSQPTSLSNIISNIVSAPTSSTSYCVVYKSAITCLLTATNGCAALTDIAYQQLSAWNGTQASSICNAATFQRATTSSPLAIFHALSTPQTVTTTQASSAGLVIGDGSGQFLIGWIVLIAVGGALLVIITVLIICLIRNTTHNNKRRRIYSEDHEPSSPVNIVTKSPGWRYKTSNAYRNNDLDLALKQSVFRRDFLR